VRVGAKTFLFGFGVVVVAFVLTSLASARGWRIVEISAFTLAVLGVLTGAVGWFMFMIAMLKSVLNRRRDSKSRS
jgi:hypothetical protein